MTLLLASSLLSPHAGLIFWTLIVFGLLLFVLGKYAWKPMVSALDEREKTIEESLTRAESALEEASRMQEDNEAARRDAERQAQSILRDARDASDQLRSEEVEKTKAQLAHLQEQARVDIEREKTQALVALRAEVAELAIGAAGKILDENLDDARQRKLVDAFLDDLPQK